jgi:hypothetical protein
MIVSQRNWQPQLLSVFQSQLQVMDFQVTQQIAVLPP